MEAVKKIRDYLRKHLHRKSVRNVYKDEAIALGLKREILEYAENIDELNMLEEKYVDRELNNPLCLNVMSGGYGRVVKKEVIDAMSKTKRDAHLHFWTNGKEIKLSKECPREGFILGRKLDGYSWYNNGTQNIYSKECPEGFKKGTKPTTLGKEPGNKGKKTNLIPWNKGLTKEINIKLQEASVKCSNTNNGKHYSPNTEWKKGHNTWNKGTKGLTKANKTSFHGEHRGMKWYNNGVEQYRGFEKPLGDSWKEGMLKGMKWYNNGVIRIKATQKPDGDDWVEGMNIK